MFVCSVRAGTVKFFGIVCIALAALVCLIAFVPELQPAAAVSASEQEVTYEKVRSNEDRIAFLAQFGWQVEETPVESASVTIPKDFDKVFSAYNELQKSEGRDLSKYSGKSVERYTYTVTNYPGYEGTVLANLLISHGKVIGGDICSADNAGFLHGFSRQ